MNSTFSANPFSLKFTVQKLIDYMSRFHGHLRLSEMVVNKEHETFYQYHSELSIQLN